MDNSFKDLHCCFIIQAVPPYHADFTQVLALPTGFRYHNRYSEQWVDPNLRNNIRQLQGKRVLMIMRDRERNRLVPVRWSKIDVAQAIGNIYYFEHLLGDLVVYSRDSTDSEAEIDRYTTILHTYHNELPGSPNTDLTSPSVFLSSAGRDIQTAPASDLSRWGNLVAAVGTASIYLKADFLKVVGLITPDQRRTAKLAGEQYEVSPNTVYTLKVFQTIPNFGDGRVDPHDLRLLAFSGHVASLRDRQRAVGKYDMLSFDLKVLNLPSGERTTIEVQHEPRYEPGAYAASSLTIPLVVRQRNVVLPALRLAIAVAALIFVFAPKYVPADQQLVRNLANVIFVLAVDGASRTLQAIWPALPWR